MQKQLARDVELGILERVLANEPTEWQHDMVVVRKTNGSPRRTIDMQKLNATTLRQTHSGSFLSEGHVGSGGHVQNGDRRLGRISKLPLDEESSKLTQFIKPFGCFCYLTNPQGNHVSGDGPPQRCLMSASRLRTASSSKPPSPSPSSTPVNTLLSWEGMGSYRTQQSFSSSRSKRTGRGSELGRTQLPL